ncbi:MAG: citrate lyase acyl carrier protein [Salinivirgaceae bacterium]|jgi:citrate lyase subunit beta/citryl-CoA lyase|nr:citrate lyase acyl carrier protein [Salinivirgaceae bacterium]
MNEVCAGNKGPKIKSDCHVTFQKTQSGGISIRLKSKVAAMFGEQIENITRATLQKLGVEHAELTIEDTGALDWMIAARVEAAVKQAGDIQEEFWPEFKTYSQYSTSRDRDRLSRLYLPGNNPKMMLNAGIHYPHGVILDLEDAVAPAKKHEARFMVRNALRSVNFYGAERMVRINQGDMGIEDLAYVVPHNVHLILVPKVEDPNYLRRLDEEVKRIQAYHKIDNPIYYMPIIESALGVERAFEIASACENTVALAIGLEDYTADIGVKRTNTAEESLYARMRLVNAAKAAGIQPIDSVFSDVGDMQALFENVRKSKQLGFEGMGCIHPRQIKVIHQGFAPEPAELEKSMKIVDAAQKAEAQGLGVVSIGTKMIDPPVVKRHTKQIDRAIRMGVLEENWQELLND